MIHYAPKTDNRRDLDPYVRELYDRYTNISDRYSRSGYNALIRGGANELHRFGSIIIPHTTDGVHVLRLDESQQV